MKWRNIKNWAIQKGEYVEKELGLSESPKWDLHFCLVS